MADVKMTKAQMFEAIKSVAEVSANPDMVAFIDKELEALAKRNSKETKTQKENKVLKEVVFDSLDVIGKPVTVTELIKGSVDLADLTPQKVVALLKMLVAENRVLRDDSNKKQTLFSVLVAEDEEEVE